VYGTDIFDVNPKLALDFFAQGLHIIKRTGCLFVGLAEQGIYHFRDVCDIILGRKFAKNFFRYFFRNEAVNCGCFNGETPLKYPTPFCRNMTTAFFVFAYKETGITFKSDNYDFEKA
jgi:hypothetical protein